MRLTKLVFFTFLSATFFIGCSNDDDTVEEVPLRDRGEQAVEDDAAIIEYMETHFYNYEDFQNPPEGFDYRVRFDTISAANADKTPIIESDLLETRTFTREDVEQNYYILKIREGEGDKPTFADSTFQNYRGELLNRSTFDNTANPVWFDHPGTGTQGNPGIAVVAFTQALTEFGEATGFKINDDNTVTWNNDFGVGAVFAPSGLGYFNNPTATIPSYSPLIFSFQLYGVNEADHDRDGVPSYMEDLNDNLNLMDDDTDGDNAPNYLDSDDDGDGTPTRQEITIEADGTLILHDENGDGTPNYLDSEVFLPVSED